MRQHQSPLWRLGSDSLLTTRKRLRSLITTELITTELMTTELMTTELSTTNPTP